MYVAQPGHIDHIKRNNAGSVYKLIDQYGLFLVSNYLNAASLHLPVSPRSPES